MPVLDDILAQNIKISIKKVVGPQRAKSGVVVDHSRDELLTPNGTISLKNSYMVDGETPQLLYARVANHLGTNPVHAQRLYDYMSKQWFSPATPILSNAGLDRGNLISCYLNQIQDSLVSIREKLDESFWLSAGGGGIGTGYQSLRSVGEKIGRVGKTSGIIPFIKMQEAQTVAVSQGSLRRANAAVYIDIDHPEIEEFLDIRKPMGGDPMRKAIHLHHGIMISDKFMKAVEADENFDLLSPKNKEVISTISARSLWVKILMARVETGEPYIVFKDTVHKATPEAHKTLKLFNSLSNLCSEIVLPTGIDHLGNDRTAVCCLSSLNLLKWDEWNTNPHFIPDIMEMLDNVLQDFIDFSKSPNDSINAAIYAASRERSVGLGVMGWHSFLQNKGVPFTSVIAKSWNKRIFKHIREQADRASVYLADVRGPNLDAHDANVHERFTYKMAIAPTASISVICGGTSPGIDPITSNAYQHKTKDGSFIVKNPFLERLLEKYGHNNDTTWREINQYGGSVQHLEYLTDHEKETFKTALEIDPMWIIEHAADRAPYIDQAQSVNLWMPANVNKTLLHAVHFSAWKKGVKSLYYLRSESLGKAENTNAKATPIVGEAKKYDECLSCQ